MIENEEFIEDFVEDARTHIETAENCLVQIDANAPDLEIINSLFRAVHSMKGTAGFFNLTNIVKLSHSMENLLVEVRNGEMLITNDMIDALIESNDCLKGLIEDVLNSDVPDISNYINSIKAFMNTEISKEEDPNNETKIISEINHIETVVENKQEIKIEPVVGNEKEIKIVTNLEVESEIIKSENPAEFKQLPDKDMPEVSAHNKVLTVEDSIRVHVSLLNNLLNLASEMVLGRNQLLRAMENHRKSIPGIESILQNIDHITTELQERVMQTRMQPVSNVFSKFPKIIRELAKKLGKDMELKIDGADVELDKSIIEALGDPLTHLIRNAADHGLERPEVREKNGKNRVGNIAMKAYHEGGYVNIDIIDDGAGIDVDVIKKKALEKMLIDRSEASTMGELEILQLLFKPGFSTVEVITDVSGRGVGMDVVKTNIEKLGGTIEIFTVLGQGTTFRLLLPLTLAIIPSIIVDVEGQKFALPQVNLQEIVRIKPGDVNRRLEFVNNAEVLRLRGGLLPIMHLARVIGLGKTYIDETTKELKTNNRNTILGYKPETSEEYFKREIKGAIRILVIKIGSRKIGLVVDAIYGSEEILVKPLPSFIKECKCYSGVTIMGDGKIAMILDPEGIIEKSNLHFADYLEDKRKLDIENEEDAIREQQSLLLFKCSGEETLAADISMISRVEEVLNSDIEKIGDKEFIKFRGDTLRLIRPENYLPITKNEEVSKKRYVIIPKHIKHSMGILIEKIEDTIRAKVKLASEDVSAMGIIGSSIINNKIVVLINIYELFEMAEPEKFKEARSYNSDKNMVVLLVEDTPFFLKVEKGYIENAGYKVLTATNGKEALQVLQHQHIDAVVSDIQMPIMDGIELIKRIRSDKKLCNLPVVALTSMTTELQKSNGLDAGFDVYEFKIDKERLINAIDDAIALRGN